MKHNSITQSVKAEKLASAAKGNLSLLEFTEAHQTRLQATDAKPAHREWLKAKGLGHYDPSELFSSI